jgi:hypothetical protein
MGVAVPKGTGGRVLVGLGIVLVVVLVALGLDRLGGDDSTDRSDDAQPSTTPTVSVADDGEWCARWESLVQLQAQYVATQSPEDGEALLTAVEELRGLGYPESLDESGHTELDAVLDDLRASVDPSFTPSVLPSEPADVENADEAPFGTFLAEHCAA